jgi:cytochrome c-type biogenesis protein CcmE
MSSSARKYAQFGAATAVIVLSLGYLAYTGVQQSKSYYVTIGELRGMGDAAHSKRLRVGGFVQPGSIKRKGTHVDFVLAECEPGSATPCTQDKLIPIEYTGVDAPPDTFKDDSQALAEGTYGRDGVFHAQGLQAKCASKYAPADDQKPSAPADNKAAAGPSSGPPADASAQPSGSTQ